MAELKALQNRYVITKGDLPLSCPMPDTELWDAHPKVYLPIESKGEINCPYCNAHYTLEASDD